MLLSDRDIRAELDCGRVVLEPYDQAMVQPSSVDVRLDRFFRLFDNHKYAVIDPAEDQPDLTRLVEVDPDDAFVLHPGEFVLGSTYELVTLPTDLAARLEGKALWVDTPVPTPDGWTTMGRLEVGDQVFDQDGRRCFVVAATEVMHGRPCRRVHFSDGSSVVADASHQWVTVSKGDRMHQRRNDGQIRTTDEIARSLRAGAEWNHHVRLCGAVDYPEQELPIDPYVLGVWLGDGTSSTAAVTVGEGDEQILDEIRRAEYDVHRVASTRTFRIGSLSVRSDGRRRDEQGRWRSDGSLASTLRQQGLLGNKHVPELFLRGSVEQRLALLQGLMDSDGHADVYGRCEFTSTSERLADAVVTLAASLGLRPTVRKKTARLNGIDCGVAHQVKFTPRLPVFRLERKLARLKADARAHSFRAVVAVEEIPTVPVRCIQVSAPSGTFLAGPTYIPTHNSSLGRLGLLTHSTAGFIDPGFSGHVTLELSNVATLPIKLWPGMKIGQMCFFRLSSAAEHPYGSDRYGSRYQGQRGPTASRSFKNFHRTQT